MNPWACFLRNSGSIPVYRTMQTHGLGFDIIPSVQLIFLHTQNNLPSCEGRVQKLVLKSGKDDKKWKKGYLGWNIGLKTKINSVQIVTTTILNQYPTITIKFHTQIIFIITFFYVSIPILKIHDFNLHTTSIAFKLAFH